jgi:hypothetical protein
LKEASRVQHQAFRLAERQPFHHWVPPEEDAVGAKRHWQGGATKPRSYRGFFLCPEKGASCPENLQDTVETILQVTARTTSKDFARLSSHGLKPKSNTWVQTFSNLSSKMARSSPGSTMNQEDCWSTSIGSANQPYNSKIISIFWGLKPATEEQCLA